MLFYKKWCKAVDTLCNLQAWSVVLGQPGAAADTGTSSLPSLCYGPGHLLPAHYHAHDPHGWRDCACPLPALHRRPAAAHAGQHLLLRTADDPACCCPQVRVLMSSLLLCTLKYTQCTLQGTLEALMLTCGAFAGFGSLHCADYCCWLPLLSGP